MAELYQFVRNVLQRLLKKIRKIIELGILLINYVSGLIFLLFLKNGKRFIVVMSQMLLELIVLFFEMSNIKHLTGGNIIKLTYKLKKKIELKMLCQK
jgi:hypothetical protein